MRGTVGVFFAAIGAALTPAHAIDPHARTVSSSQQFVVYCEDAAVRGRVAGFAEEVRNDLLRLLDDHERGKSPIVITLARAQTPDAIPVRLHAFAGADGSTIEIDVQIGDEPEAVNLRKQIVRAVLLELAYRDRGGIKGGESYVEAPWWLVEGALQTMARRDSGVAPEFFQRLIETNKLPAIERFLDLQDLNPGSTAETIDGACAMCLVELLLEQPNGRANLNRLIRRWPELHADPIAALIKEFPGLGADSGALQKWWTLSVARFSAADRFRGLSAEETDKELAGVVTFECVVDKKGEKKKFAVQEFAEFVKLPGCKAAMITAQAALVRLSTRANALFRPVVAEYERVFGMLARGKTKGLAQRIDNVAHYRQAVLHRVDQIADYLNWFEATQLGMRSEAFDGFLKAATQLSADEAKARASDPVARYLDQLQDEF